MQKEKEFVFIFDVVRQTYASTKKQTSKRWALYSLVFPSQTNFGTKSYPKTPTW